MTKYITLVEIMLVLILLVLKTKYTNLELRCQAIDVKYSEC